MPLFEFVCGHCEHRVEKLMHTSAEADEARLVCDREDCPGFYIRVLSAANFALKGSGWTPKHYGEK